jgi:RecA/RadA recombinase
MSADIFKSVEKLNEDATTLSDSNLSVVKEWIDTGCMALNAICSGSLYKGVPKGRIIGFAGPSMCLTKNQQIKVYRFRTENNENNENNEKN